MRFRIALLVLFVVPVLAAQNAEEERLRELHLLGLQKTRYGAIHAKSAGPHGEPAENYDESKGGPVSPLPDPLVFNNGTRVRTVKQWQQRRKELFEIFDREVYGRVPADVPAVSWSVTKTDHGTEEFDDEHGHHRIAYTTRHLIGHVDNTRAPQIKVDIVADLTLPDEHAGRVPVEVSLSWRFRTWPTRTKPLGPSGPTWQQQLLARGWGFVELSPTSIQADSGDGLNEGIIGLTNAGKPRTLDQWGALRAWAWGASKVADYLETLPEVDTHRLGVDGHSRYGKAALVAMAYDDRFAFGYISSAGTGGDKFWRRTYGELMENLAATGEYHWMAGNFLKYSADPLHASDLPVDQHELIALCAPRKVFVGVGMKQGDGWADPHGEFMTAVAAGPVYHLYGLKGVAGKQGEVKEFPRQGEALVEGAIGFRQHAWGHTQEPNWKTYLDFVEKRAELKAKARP